MPKSLTVDVHLTYFSWGTLRDFECYKEELIGRLVHKWYRDPNGELPDVLVVSNEHGRELEVQIVGENTTFYPTFSPAPDTIFVAR